MNTIVISCIDFGAVSQSLMVVGCVLPILLVTTHHPLLSWGSKISVLMRRTEMDVFWWTTIDDIRWWMFQLFQLARFDDTGRVKCMFLSHAHILKQKKIQESFETPPLLRKMSWFVELKRSERTWCRNITIRTESLSQTPGRRWVYHVLLRGIESGRYHEISSCFFPIQ